MFGLPTNVTATSLKVVVPPGATTGTISVRTPAATSPASATPFTVTFSVTSISPTSGNYNDDVTVNGVGLTGVTAVKFNGIAGAIQPGGTASVLHVHVPAAGTVTGHVTVWKSLVSVQAPQDFTLLVVSSMAPTSGVLGRTVVLTGHGFTGTTSVKFNGTTAAYVVDSDTQITAQAPAGATSGTISVTTPAGTATSSSSFTVGRVVINEFSTGTTAHSDDEFVELKNTGSGDVDVSGCRLFYQGAGDLAEAQIALIPASTTITAASRYYVLGGANYSGTSDLPSPLSADLDATDGSLALRCGPNPGTANDSVGWGTDPAGFAEVTPAGAPPVDQSAARTPDGTDTGDNSSDFVIATTPTPRADNGP